MLTLNSKSPSVEKKITPVIEKNDIVTESTSDRKKVTPSKIMKTNDGGRRPGPKSKTCAQELKIEKTSSLSNKIEINPEQIDNNNVDITDTIEAESKKISVATKENNKDKIAVSPINFSHTDNIIKMESNKIKQTTNLANFENSVKFEIVEESTIICNHLDKEKNKNTIIRVKGVTSEPRKEEDDIQDEELDHEIYEELDHEFDELEIIENNFGLNTVKSIQEHNKDDNNEDSINLTIGEDDIKLFADEEDTNIEKEDEVIGNQTKEETSSIKLHESCHPVTSSRSSTGLAKSRRSATEKRPSVGNKLRSIHKQDEKISNAKPINNVSVFKDEKKEVEKQVKDKVEAGNKQRFVLNMVLTTDSLSLHWNIATRI